MSSRASSSSWALTTELEIQARQFAGRLTVTVRELVPDCAPFVARLLVEKRRRKATRVVVVQDPATGIPLAVEGRPILTLKVEYYCSLDTSGEWLATDEAHIKVHAGSTASDEPLFHYHYRRKANPDLAAAHLHVYAHRDALSHVMASSGSATRRGRAKSTGQAVPRTRDLHFPLGGHRFRPCLEDVLEMLVLELGVDHPDGALSALREGRAEWRRNQTRTVVRDDPDEVIRYLNDLGYDVTLRTGCTPPEGRPERLRQI